MKPKRIKPTKKLSDEVLREFRYRCAICGRHDPQLHHIDEDPSNTVAENLIPLCPNCHLQDLHDPTSSPDPLKIKLFRRTKDPFVLDSRFDPIWTRMRFLTPGRTEADESWQYCCTNLLDFIESFKKGKYYRKRVFNVLQNTADYHSFYQKRDGLPANKEDFGSHEEYFHSLQSFLFRTIEDLCVEMLRYQEWKIPRGSDES